MKTKFLKPWAIISPFDLEDNETSRISPKPEIRIKSKKSRSPISIKIRKSLPKRIESSSHILTPTKSSLLKSVEKPKRLTKSRSASDLRKNEKQVQEEEKILSELKQRVSELDEEFQGLPNRMSVPFDLNIDTDRIEKDYSSPVLRKKQDPVIFTLLNSGQKSESLPFDPLSGKIYSSYKEIEFSQHVKSQKRRKNKKRDLMTEIQVEIAVEEEIENDKIIFWMSFAQQLTKLRRGQEKIFISQLKIHAKRTRRVKNLVSRRTRSLAAVSLKIEEIIHTNLEKPESFLQDLLEKPAEIKSLNIFYKSQYLQSEEFLVDLMISLWGKCLKPLTPSKISVFVKIDQIFSELEAEKESFSADSRLLDLIPLLLTTDRLEEAETFLERLSSKCLVSSKGVMWKAFSAILTGKSTSKLFYSLSELAPPANFSLPYKIAQVYTFFHSCIFLKTSRTASFTKTLALGEWENIILADLYLKSQDKSSEEAGSKLFESLFERSSNIFLKFLSFFRLFHLFKSYNQTSRALELLKSAEKVNFPEDLKSLVDSLLVKTFAKMNTELKLDSEVPLLKYQFSRLSLKYNLRSSLNQILKNLNETSAYCETFSLKTCKFSVNFWKFLLLHKLKIQKLAKKQAEKTLMFTSKDPLKVSVIQELLKSFESLENLLQTLSNLALRKDLSGVLKVSASLEKFDDFLAACVKTIVSRVVLNKEKIPIHKFEGFFALWSVFYRNSKNKEKQFKCLEGQEEVDRRDNKHPLYILEVKVNRKSRKIGRKSFG